MLGEEPAEFSVIVILTAYLTLWVPPEVSKEIIEVLDDMLTTCRELGLNEINEPGGVGPVAWDNEKSKSAFPVLLMLTVAIVPAVPGGEVCSIIDDGVLSHDLFWLTVMLRIA